MTKIIKDLDLLIKEKRNFLYKKYKEYFKKTDGYCKSSEMACYVKFFIQEHKYIELQYDTYFDIESEKEIQKEVPLLILSGLNESVENKLIDLEYSNKKNKIDEKKGNQILKILGYSDKDIDKLLKNFKIEQTNLLSMLEAIDSEIKDVKKGKEKTGFSAKKKEELKDLFYNEKIYHIIHSNLFKIQFKDLDGLYNMNLKKELLIKNLYFSQIQDVIGIDNDQLFQLNELNINSMVVSIYSYVFGPSRYHDFNGKTYKSIKENIEKGLNEWDFTIEEE